MRLCLVRPRQLRHADAEPLHLTLDNLLFPLQRTLFTAQTLVANLSLQLLQAALAVLQVRQRIRQTLHGGAELLAATAAGALVLALFRHARVGDARHECRVLHQALVLLAREEVIGDGGVGAESLCGCEVVDLAADALLAKRAGGGLLEAWW